MNQQADAGVWIVKGNTLILDIPNLLASAGLEDTPKNRELAVKATLEVTREMIPDIVTLAVIGITPRRWDWERKGIGI